MSAFGMPKFGQAKSQLIAYVGDMDRDFLLRHIAEAERHVIETQAFIQQHHKFIARLRKNSGDTRHAERLLHSTIGILSAHEQYLDGLRRLLATSNATQWLDGDTRS